MHIPHHCFSVFSFLHQNVMWPVLMALSSRHITPYSTEPDIRHYARYFSPAFNKTQDRTQAHGGARCFLSRTEWDGQLCGEEKWRIDLGERAIILERV